MTPAMADIVGLAGSAIFIGAFAYANFAKRFDKLWFNIANLVGAVLLLASLWINFNLAAFVLEIAWGVIASVGIAAALRARSAAP